MSFSENLQTLRKSHGISQEQLAERLNVSRQAVSKWETDGGYPEMDKIIQLCDLFDVTMDELIKGQVEVDKADIRKKYDRHFGSFAKGIATGVFLIIAGVAVSSFNFRKYFGAGTGSLSNGIVFMFFAVGIALLIIFGLKNSSFERENPVIPDIYASEEREKFNTKIFPYFIAGGLALIFIGIIITMIINPDIGNTLFLLLLAAAVWLFNYAGITHDKFDVEDYNRECDFEQGIKDTDPPEIVRQKKAKSLVRRICGVIMLTATAVYLLIGFVWNIWSPSWAIFPVCGIICAIVHLVIRTDK